MVQSSPASIDETACIGMYTELGNNVIIEANSTIFDLVVIEPFTVIHKNSTIGKRTYIKDRCTIGRNVTIGKEVKIAYQTTIADHSKVYDFAKIGNNSSWCKHWQQ